MEIGLDVVNLNQYRLILAAKLYKTPELQISPDKKNNVTPQNVRF